MDKEYLSFKKNSPEVQKLIEWWDDLEKKHRGERAVLRRCGTLAEVVFSPAYHRLRKTLMNIGRFDDDVDDRLSLIVGLSVRAKPNADGASVAEQMATGKPDGSARVSGLRFRRLLKVNERDDLFAAMSRIIALLGGTTNLQSLAQSVYFWNDKTRKEWAFEYYSKAPDEK